MADLFDVRGELAGGGSFQNHARLKSNYISFLSMKYSYTFHFRPQPREITQILKYDDNTENLDNWTQCDGPILHRLRVVINLMTFYPLAATIVVRILHFVPSYLGTDIKNRCNCYSILRRTFAFN